MPRPLLLRPARVGPALRARSPHEEKRNGAPPQLFTRSGGRAAAEAFGKPATGGADPRCGLNRKSRPCDEVSAFRGDVPEGGQTECARSDSWVHLLGGNRRLHHGLQLARNVLANGSNFFVEFTVDRDEQTHWLQGIAHEVLRCRSSEVVPEGVTVHGSKRRKVRTSGPPNANRAASGTAEARETHSLTR
jgi:hypothetical protein